MKTKQKTRRSTLSADGVLHLSCPQSWREMTEEQMRYALLVIGNRYASPVEWRTMLLLHFTGIKVHGKTPYGWNCTVKVADSRGRHSTFHFFLQAWQVQSMINQLEYVDSYETFDVRLESVGGFKAVDRQLHGVRFFDYLSMEKYYQGYIATREEKYIVGLAKLLYPGAETFDIAELTNCACWFAHTKMGLSRYFRHFFKPAPVSDGKPVDWLAQANIQIRALTDGDITKEDAVLNKDCWRVLTELDARAREAEEFRKKYHKT